VLHPTVIAKSVMATPPVRIRRSRMSYLST
jgi:hypothetical protein